MENQTVTEEEKTAEAQAEQTEAVEEVEQVEPEVKQDEYKEKYFYLAAEMDNMKKRFEREKTNLLKYGNEGILQDLIEVQDNFDRTVSALSADQDEKMKNVVTGIQMIGKQFVDTLAKHGLKEISPSEGEEFDPNFHEAMAQQEVEGKEKNQIVQVYRNGFELNGRLIRAAKVIVAK